MHQLRKIVGTIVLLLLAIFSLQNLGMVSIDFFIWSAEAPRALVYLLLFLTGAVTGLLISRYPLFSRGE